MYECLMLFLSQDTTASSLTRFMCMMAENPDLQVRLRQEILNAGAVSTPSYPCLKMY